MSENPLNRKSSSITRQLGSGKTVAVLTSGGKLEKVAENQPF